MRVHTEAATDDPPGDILTRYDPARRTGFRLGLMGGGATFSQPHAGHLRFGIDTGRAGGWEDLGRPGNALLAFALAVHDSDLDAGTCEPGKGEAGRG
ncbi:hypothetical protein J0H58_37785 [bacterium]|nr:hypothetical protein [bacterium]